MFLVRAHLPLELAQRRVLICISDTKPSTSKTTMLVLYYIPNSPSQLTDIHRLKQETPSSETQGIVIL
jgi:hypothetical protein